MALKSGGQRMAQQGSSEVKFAIFTTTFVDLCRSNGGSYDFSAMETFVQHAKIYKYTDFHPNRSGGGGIPIGSLPCPFNCISSNFLFKNNLKELISNSLVH